MKIRRYIIIALASLIALPALADSNGKNQFNPVQTGVTSLGIAPDARGAAMGDLGWQPNPTPIRNIGTRRNTPSPTARRQSVSPTPHG